jgi:hypothetical protein
LSRLLRVKGEIFHRLQSGIGLFRDGLAFGRVLPLCDFLLESFELFLHTAAKDINVEGGAVVGGPGEDDHEESCTSPARPEPQRTGYHGNEGIAVLNEHEGWPLKDFRQRKHKLAEEVLCVRLAKPRERCWTSYEQVSDVLVL